MDSFDDIYGYENEKRELMMICDMIRDSENYQKAGINISKSLLIHGDPGVGKTLMAKVFVEQSGRRSYILRRDAGDAKTFVKHINETFANAKANAPSIIFLDDLDKFAEVEKGFGNSAEFSAVQTCMDELENADIFVIATANTLDALPSSLLRAGRFGNRLYVERPTQHELRAIIPKFSVGKSLDKRLDNETLGYLLDGMTCAEVKHIFERATMLSLFEKSEYITARQFVLATVSLCNILPHQSRNNKEHWRRISIHEAGHAVMTILTGNAVGVVTTLGAERHLGLICPVIDEDTLPEHMFRSKMLIKLAGRAAVELIEGVVDLGAWSDLMDTMDEAEVHIFRRGGEGLEYLYDYMEHSEMQAQMHLDELMDIRHELVCRLYEECKCILADNKQAVLKIAELLETEEFLLHNDVKRIVMGA